MSEQVPATETQVEAAEFETGIDGPLVGIVMGFFLFIVLPNVLTEQFRRVGYTNPTGLNALAGVVKLVVFLGYLWLISRLPDIRKSVW